MVEETKKYTLTAALAAQSNTVTALTLNVLYAEKKIFPIVINDGILSVITED